ncbi:hypothetical protein [Rugamonas apoptosis]|uniref:Uncharacterized protein n=1 Tax=Rugamonas apoptosis TaxID=2758570 RepID=A0A7W2IJU9_9BURK|nr:hypothetical protein [Rugamonas apoptosis]MBA5686717.1 hypothetical protein [Rugamonas apoptosis]
MVSPSIVSLVINGALAAMQVKNHFDVKKLQTAIAQLLGELPLQETEADAGEFTRLLHLLRSERSEAAQKHILALMDQLDAAERNVFRALMAARRSPNHAGVAQHKSTADFQALDRERLDFLADLAEVAAHDMDEALMFLRTGVGITPKPGAAATMKWYASRTSTFIAERAPQLIGWIKAGALKTHGAVVDTTPRKQSLAKVFLGKLLVGGIDGSAATSNEIQFLNQLFAQKAKQANKGR